MRSLNGHFLTPPPCVPLMPLFLTILIASPSLPLPKLHHHAFSQFLPRRISHSELYSLLLLQSLTFSSLGNPATPDSLPYLYVYSPLSSLTSLPPPLASACSATPAHLPSKHGFVTCHCFSLLFGSSLLLARSPLH